MSDKNPLSVGDRIRIKRSDGTASDAVVQKLMIILVGKEKVLEPKQDVIKYIGKTILVDNEPYLVTQGYTVTWMNPNGRIFKKTIPSSDVIAKYLLNASEANAVKAAAAAAADDDDDDDEGAPGAPGAQDGGKNMKRSKRSKRSKRTKRTKRIKRTKRTYKRRK